MYKLYIYQIINAFAYTCDLVTFLLPQRDTMIKAAYQIKHLIGFHYSFTEWVHGHRGREHGGRQIGIALQQ